MSSISWFSKYPTIQYQYLKPDNSVSNVEQTDINIKFALRDVVKQSAETMYSYSWKGGDRIDILADMYYDDSRFFWLVCLSNDIFDMLNEFPLSDSVFSKHIYKKYRTDAIANGFSDDPNDVMRYIQKTIHEYRDDEGYVIDEQTYHDNPGGSRRTIYDIETDENDKRRKIKLIDKELSGSIENELEKAFNKIKAKRKQNG